MEDKNTTTHLLTILKNAKTADINALFEQYVDKSLTEFPFYMDALISQKGLKRQDVFQKADIPRKYGYKLLRGETRTTDRDKLLRIFFAVSMTLKEVQRALTLYGLPILYPKIKRDMVFIIAFNRGVASVDMVNEWLVAEGEAELNRIND